MTKLEDIEEFNYISSILTITNEHGVYYLRSKDIPDLIFERMKILGGKCQVRVHYLSKEDSESYIIEEYLAAVEFSLTGKTRIGNYLDEEFDKSLSDNEITYLEEKEHYMTCGHDRWRFGVKPFLEALKDLSGNSLIDTSKFNLIFNESMKSPDNRTMAIISANKFYETTMKNW